MIFKKDLESNDNATAFYVVPPFAVAGIMKIGSMLARRERKAQRRYQHKKRKQ